jgi:hypothetical protein
MMELLAKPARLLLAAAKSWVIGPISMMTHWPFRVFDEWGYDQYYVVAVQCAAPTSFDDACGLVLVYG